jgi:PAS domain S-box-containing protein
MARPASRQGYLLALLVLVGSLVLVVSAWQIARARELRAAELAFAGRAGEAVDRMRNRLGNYELVAQGGTALFASVARPTPRQWANYVEGLELRERFPALTGLGYAAMVSNNRLDELQIEWRDQGYGQLAIRPHGLRDVYGPTLFLEPRSANNLASIGGDLLTQPAMRQAMLAARDSGNARLTQPLTAAVGAPPSLVLFVPVYQPGARPLTPAARQASSRGWIYAPFDMRTFVQASLGREFDDLGFRILDVTDGGAVELNTTAGREAGEPAFRHVRVIEVHGRRWQLEFVSTPMGMASPQMRALENMLALGLVASLLLFGMVLALARTEVRAQTIALRLTEDYRRSEQRFRSSLQYSAIGTALLDSDGRIVEANPALGRIVGRPVNSLIGQPLQSLFDDMDTPLVQEAVQPSSSDDAGVRRETRHLRREGDLPRQAQLIFAPVPGNVGQDVTGLVQVEDVTDRVRAQARVHALNRTLEARVELRTRELLQANQELEAFAYSVSHDLRAPLRAIDGFSRVLGERYADRLDESGLDYLGRVRKAAARMGELIDAILVISRLGRAELRREPVDLTRVAVEVLDELRAGDRGREVEVRIAPGLQAVGDATLLRNLLGNLLGNSWKFTRGREPAVIEFGSITHPDGEPEFYVRDNGAGFAQAYVDKLFRPFQRLHSTQDYAGHGIGLASVKRIIERHGGTIRAEGREGEGAVFYFTLP